MLTFEKKKLIGLLILISILFSGPSTLFASVKPGVKGGLSLVGLDWNNPGFSISYRFLNRHIQFDFPRRLGFQGVGFGRADTIIFQSGSQSADWRVMQRRRYMVSR